MGLFVESFDKVELYQGMNIDAMFDLVWLLVWQWSQLLSRRPQAPFFPKTRLSLDRFRLPIARFCMPMSEDGNAGSNPSLAHARLVGLTFFICPQPSPECTVHRRCRHPFCP